MRREEMIAQLVEARLEKGITSSKCAQLTMEW